MEEQSPAAAPTDELTGEKKRGNVVRLAFDGSEAKLEAFVETVRQGIPPNTGVGSGVAVVQDPGLEAEAERMGVRVAMVPG